MVKVISVSPSERRSPVLKMMQVITVYLPPDRIRLGSAVFVEIKAPLSHLVGQINQQEFERVQNPLGSDQILGSHPTSSTSDGWCCRNCKTMNLTELNLIDRD